MINVRWAHEDPNPVAKSYEEQVLAGHFLKKVVENRPDILQQVGVAQLPQEVGERDPFTATYRSCDA